MSSHDLRRSQCSLLGRSSVDPLEAVQMTGQSLNVWTRHYVRSFGTPQATRRARLLTASAPLACPRDDRVGAEGGVPLPAADRSTSSRLTGSTRSTSACQRACQGVAIRDLVIASNPSLSGGASRTRTDDLLGAIQSFAEGRNARFAALCWGAPKSRNIPHNRLWLVLHQGNGSPEVGSQAKPGDC